jgi:hypothetical protein
MATRFKFEKLKNGNVRTCEVRASYVNLLKPRDNNGKLKYSMLALIPPGADVSVLKAEIERAGKDKFGDKWEGLKRANKVKLPLKDQSDLVDDEGEPRAGAVAGGLYFNCAANADRRPAIIDAAMNPLDDANEVYSGMYCRVSVRAYAYDVDGSKGVSLGLQAVQKLWDAEALGGSGPVDPNKEFEPVEIEDGQSAESVFD